MKKLQALFLALLILCGTLAPTAKAQEAPPPGQIGVAPSMLELSIGSKPVNESLRLFNLKKTPTKVSVEVYNWTLDENNEVKLLPPDEQSLDQWMLINPMSFILEPGKSQVVRLSVRPSVKPAPGEHRAIIYFTEEPVEGATETEDKPVEILFKLGVGIYAYADDVRRSSSMPAFRFDNKALTLKAPITNSGNVHTRLKGTYSIWEKKHFPGLNNAEKYMKEEDSGKQPQGLVASGQLNQTPVLPGKTRTIITQLPEPRKPGSYIIAVSGELDEKKIEKTFAVSR